MSDDDVDMDEEHDPIRAVMRLFDQHDDAFLRFKDVEAPLHPSSTLCALMKLASMMKDPSKFDVQASHDRLYLPTLDEMKSPVTSEDVLYLTRCGVFWDSDHDCFGMHC